MLAIASTSRAASTRANAADRLRHSLNLFDPGEPCRYRWVAVGAIVEIQPEGNRVWPGAKSGEHLEDRHRRKVSR
jgi:hypothetical protein